VNQDGYTLTEMLAALLMIGLAVGGLAQAMRLLGSAQGAASHRLHQTQSLRAAESGLAAMLSVGGPYRSSNQDFAGDSGSMSFACGGIKPCAASLVEAKGGVELYLKQEDTGRVFALPADHARFMYEGETAADHWPPEGPRQVLRAIHVVSAGNEPVFTSRIWAEQPVECAFDSISRDCRETPQ
jgi:prepilin-type N-terminal cleavage/methylation domain-containing protein